MKKLLHDLNISMYLSFKYQLTDQAGYCTVIENSSSYLPRQSTGMDNYFAGSCAATTGQSVATTYYVHIYNTDVPKKYTYKEI
jgi:hypothetical protein